MPVSVTGIGPSNTTSSNSTLNCYEDHRWDFDYTSLLRLSRFGAIVENGGAYAVLYAGDPPQQQQFSLSGNSPEEGIVVKIKCVTSSTLRDEPCSVTCVGGTALRMNHLYTINTHLQGTSHRCSISGIP